MSENVYVLSLAGTSHPKIMYVSETVSDRPTLKLSEAKIFPSKCLLILSRIFNTNYRWWNITCHSKKTIFTARLKGK